jgi:hypothetical protein
MKGAHPEYTAASIRNALESRAADLGAPGKDNLFGSGKLSMGETPLVDMAVPIVYDIQPTGTLAGDSATVSAYFADPDPSSGIDASSASVTVSGGTVSDCLPTEAGISCNVTGLVPGQHTVSISVSDNAGNAGTGIGSFTSCNNDKPSLSLSITGVYWGSYTDYVYGLLSVDYQLTHTGGPNAYNVTVMDSIATNGAILTTAEMPVFAVIGSASPEDPDIGNFTLIYNVPPGVQTFRTMTSISASDACGTAYTYP